MIFDFFSIAIGFLIFLTLGLNYIFILKIYAFQSNLDLKIDLINDIHHEVSVLYKEYHKDKTSDFNFLFGGDE